MQLHLTADETRGLEDLLFPLLLTSQISKRINDDTKDQIQHDDDHQEEKQKVIHDPCGEQMLLQTHIGFASSSYVKNELPY